MGYLIIPQYVTIKNPGIKKTRKRPVLRYIAGNGEVYPENLNLTNLNIPGWVLEPFLIDKSLTTDYLYFYSSTPSVYKRGTKIRGCIVLGVYIHTVCTFESYKT